MENDCRQAVSGNSNLSANANVLPSCFDIIGVVNYAGKIKRVEKFRSKVACGILEEDENEKPFTHYVRPDIHFKPEPNIEECIQYNASRWLELVDAVSDKPIQ